MSLLRPLFLELSVSSLCWICFCVVVLVTGRARRLVLVGVFARRPNILHTDRRQPIKIKIFNIASKQSGRLLWKQRCHGNGDWGGYRGNDRRHGDCITVGYIRGIRKETRSIFDHCLCAQKKAQCFFAARVSCIDNENWSRLAPVFTCRRLTIKIAKQENAYKEIVGNSYIYIFLKRIAFGLDFNAQ